MISFSLDEINLLLESLEAWEGRAKHDLAQRAIGKYAEKAARLYNTGNITTDTSIEELMESMTRMGVQEASKYTPQEVERMERERNEPAVLLKARLIMLKRETEQKVAEGVALELFRKEGESDVQ